MKTITSEDSSEPIIEITITKPGWILHEDGSVTEIQYNQQGTEIKGFTVAVNTHAGTNDGGSDPYQLRRLPIDDSSELHLLVAEACGGFDLLRRVGLDLSE